MPPPGPGQHLRAPWPQSRPLVCGAAHLHTGADLLTDKQKTRLEALFKADEHVEVEATWGSCQRMTATYREPDRVRGRTLMQQPIDSITIGVPAALTEVTKLGRTLAKRAAEILAYFDRTGTSNGPTEAINGRLEHLRGSALGFRNPTNYIARSLRESGGFRPRYTMDYEEPVILRQICRGPAQDLDLLLHNRRPQSSVAGSRISLDYRPPFQVWSYRMAHATRENGGVPPDG